MENYAATIIKTFPILEDEVQELLINENYTEASKSFKTLLEMLKEEEWGNIIWQSIITGDEVSSDAFTEEEYVSKVLPSIMTAVLEASDSKKIEIILKSVSYNASLIRLFIELYLLVVPGQNPKEKADWLKTNKKTTFIYLTASPAQELGVTIFPLAKEVPEEELKSHTENIPSHITNTILSNETAENIYRLGKENHLSDERIHAAARVIGHSMLGLIHPNDFKKELLISLALNETQISTFINTVEEEYITKNYKTILGYYVPITDILERVKPEEPFKEANEQKEILDEKTKEKEERVIHLESALDAQKPAGDITITRAEEKNTITKNNNSKTPPTKETETKNNDTPLILFKDSSITEDNSKRDKKRTFSIPFKGLFFGNKKTEKSEITQAQIDVGEAKNLENEQKIVNYSETRTTLTPFENSDSIIEFKNPKTPTPNTKLDSHIEKTTNSTAPANPNTPTPKT